MTVFREHISSIIDFDLVDGKLPANINFKGNKEAKCVSFSIADNQLHAKFSYYVGADWLPGQEGNKFIQVQSKLNTQFDKEGNEIGGVVALSNIDVLKMLFDALSEPETLKHANNLFEIKFDKRHIELPKINDLLSPLLIIQFLMIVRDIVRKGLKKGYYRTENNLYARVKGKVMVSKTIKNNILKNRNLDTFCSYEEYGLDIKENRLLKKALHFAKSYLTSISEINTSEVQQVIQYIEPSFQNVSEEISLHEIKHFHFNAFYKEYHQATLMAKIILKRFGYNLQDTQQKETINTPPYWIDMSKLFELYVLKLLKQKMGSILEYHPRTYGNELDYLLKKGKDSVVIDAKYKPSYGRYINHQDIRQVSGYARLTKILKVVGLEDQIDNPPVLSCLIIYPDQTILGDEGQLPSDLLSMPIKEYVKMYKLGVKLPIQKKGYE